MNPNTQYLDLLEDVLCFNLWPEPLKPVSETVKRGVGVSVAKGIDRVLRRAGVALGIVPNGKYWPTLAHTMIGKKRLQNIRNLCAIVEREQIPGSFVECGVWRGGASIYARACLDKSRRVYACDSFNGLPYDTREPEYCRFDFLKVGVDEVRENFRKFGQLENVEFKRGFFGPQLGEIPAPIAILRADGDMYSSTMQILEPLYPKIARGGFLIIDDWGLEPCRNAIMDYRNKHHISDEIITIDTLGVYWRKA